MAQYVTTAEATRNFVKKARLEHGDRYRYSRSIYRGYDKPFNVTCLIHKRPFITTPARHLAGEGCPVCAGKTAPPKTKLMQERYIYDLTVDETTDEEGTDEEKIDEEGTDEEKIDEEFLFSEVEGG